MAAVAPLSARQRAALAALDIPEWHRRDPAGAGPLPAAAPDAALVAARDMSPDPAPDPAGDPGSGLPDIIDTPPAGAGDSAGLWADLEARVAACTRCPLHQGRTRTVFGTGNRQAAWMVIGEAPGADEDRQGEPFVGRAGQLLNEMLRAAGAARDQVYIANIVKCRPPDNRDPTPGEAQACEAYLREQIALVRPRVLLAVGRVAARNLLQLDEPVGRLRGRIHHHAPTGTPVVVTYHPAYLLRSPLEKRRAWQDLLLARTVCAPGPE